MSKEGIQKEIDDCNIQLTAMKSGLQVLTSTIEEKKLDIATKEQQIADLTKKLNQPEESVEE